jgi:hypothetical protein
MSCELQGYSGEGGRQQQVTGTTVKQQLLAAGGGVHAAFSLAGMLDQHHLHGAGVADHACTHVDVAATNTAMAPTAAAASGCWQWLHGLLLLLLVLYFLLIYWLSLLLLLLCCWCWVWWDVFGEAVDGDEVEREDEVVSSQACTKGGGADG